MIFAKTILDKESIEFALRNKVDSILFCETKIDFQNIAQIAFINCSDNRIASSWFTWKVNNKVLISFKEKFPSFFKWGKYDMTLAYQKALYWSNQKTGFLHYTKEKYFSEEKVLYMEPMHPYNKWKTKLKYTIQRLKSSRKVEELNNFPKSKQKGIFIKNTFQLKLYKHVMKEALKNIDDYKVLTLDKDCYNRLSDMGWHSENLVFIEQQNITFTFPHVNLIKLKNEDWFVLNQLLIHWQEFGQWVEIAETITKSGVSSLLMNEAENGVFGAVMGEVLGKNGIKTFNTMNGMKAGQVQDAFINFDYWFVWDEQLKSLLRDKCGLDSSKLLVSGHLMEDEVRDFQFQNSLGIDKIQLEGKTVISVFSIPELCEEKRQTFNFIYKLAELDSELVFLLRPHPSETEEEKIMSSAELKNVYWINSTPENSKTTLYDQLSISDLSICFGSTIALESKWFGVPCITVEKRPESLIYAVDGEMIVKTEVLEKRMIHELLNKDKQARQSRKELVSEIMLSSMLNPN